MADQSDGPVYEFTDRAILKDGEVVMEREDESDERWTWICAFFRYVHLNDNSPEVRLPLGLSMYPTEEELHMRAAQALENEVVIEDLMKQPYEGWGAPVSTVVMPATAAKAWVVAKLTEEFVRHCGFSPEDAFDEAYGHAHAFEWVVENTWDPDEREGREVEVSVCEDDTVLFCPVLSPEEKERFKQLHMGDEY